MSLLSRMRKTTPTTPDALVSIEEDSGLHSLSMQPCEPHMPPAAGLELPHLAPVGCELTLITAFPRDKKATRNIWTKIVKIANKTRLVD